MRGSLQITRSSPRFGPHFDRLAACPGTTLRDDYILVRLDDECFLAIEREAKPVRPKKKLRTDCVHRRVQVGEEQCKTCTGVVMLKIFKCEVHGICAIGKAPDRVQSCKTCGDYHAKD